MSFRFYEGRDSRALTPRPLMAILGGREHGDLRVESRCSKQLGELETLNGRARAGYPRPASRDGTLSWAESVVVGFNCVSLRERLFGTGRVAGERGDVVLLDPTAVEASGGAKSAKWAGSVRRLVRSCIRPKKLRSREMVQAFVAYLLSRSRFLEPLSTSHQEQS